VPKFFGVQTETTWHGGVTNSAWHKKFVFGASYCSFPFLNNFA